MLPICYPQHKTGYRSPVTDTSATSIANRQNSPLPLFGQVRLGRSLALPKGGRPAAEKNCGRGVRCGIGVGRWVDEWMGIIAASSGP